MARDYHSLWLNSAAWRRRTATCSPTAASSRSTSAASRRASSARNRPGRSATGISGPRTTSSSRPCATGCSRRRARGHGSPRQGRLARGAATLAAPARRRVAHVAGLAVAPGRASRPDRRARPAGGHRRRPAAHRLSEGLMDGTLGSQTARLLDGSGVEITSRDELAEIVRRGAQSGGRSRCMRSATQRIATRSTRSRRPATSGEGCGPGSSTHNSSRRKIRPGSPSSESPPGPVQPRAV